MQNGACSRRVQGETSCRPRLNSPERRTRPERHTPLGPRWHPWQHQTIRSSEVAGMLASEKELVETIAQELAAGIDEALGGWMADIEDVLDSRLSDSAKLSAIQSIVNVCKRDLS